MGLGPPPPPSSRPPATSQGRVPGWLGRAEVGDPLPPPRAGRQPLPKTLRPGPRRGPGLASGTWGRYVFSIATPLNAAAMGARPSRRGRPVDPPMALDELPLELLVRVLSYVPPCTLVTRCRAVCRTWREVVDGPTVWLLQLARDRSAEGRALYALAQRCPPNSEDEEELPLCALARFSLRAPLRRNLIFNSCGEQGFRGWEVEHGGNGWAVEKNITLVPGAPSQTCFVTSFEWCFKRQLVDLVTEGLWQELLDSAQLEICVADWWGARENCGCIYRLRVRLLDVYENEVVKFSASPNPVLQWTERTCRQVSHVFTNFGKGIRYVSFEQYGRDTRSWVGHYGALVTHSSVRVRIRLS